MRESESEGKPAAEVEEREREREKENGFGELRLPSARLWIEEISIEL